MSDPSEDELVQFKVGSADSIEFEQAELLTVCQDCEYARHWHTDRYAHATPYGDDLGIEHHEETDHGLIQIVPGEFDRDRWPMVARAMDTEPSHERELTDVEGIEHSQLFEQAYAMSPQGSL